MRFTLKTLALLFALAGLARAAAAASFTATLDRDSIALGEQATLSLKFDGVQPQSPPQLPAVAGLQFQYVGPSSSFSYINGQTSASITYNYAVAAQRDGEFTIPGMRAEVNGQEFSSRPLKLMVTQASAPSSAAVNSGGEVAFLKFNFPAAKIYVGQSVVARLELYLRDDVSGLNGFQLTGSPTDGFSAGKLVELQNQRRRVQVGNRVYTVIPLALPLTAVQTGRLTLGPFTANAVIDLPGQNQDGNPFAQFFNQGEQKQVTLATAPLKVECLPLPAQGQPADFTGAVGDFSMAATVGPTTVTVGDPITVRVQIAGRGALDSLTLPPQDAWKNFKTYPPTSKLETTDQFGFQGTRTFEQIVSPLNAGVHELPALTFSFFNPADGRYHTLTQAAVPLVVKAAGASPLPPLAADKNAAPENQTPPDILPIRENLGTPVQNQAPLVAQPLFIAAQTLPVLAFFAALIWRKRTDSLANNPRRRRKIAVEKMMQNGIASLRKFAAENNPEEFFALLFRLLQEQLGERLDCPATAITENVVEENSALRAAPDLTRNDLRELFQLCNQARYAPVRGTAELNSVAAQFEKTAGELREVKA